MPTNHSKYDVQRLAAVFFHEKQRRVFDSMTPQTVGIAAVAAVLVGLFLNGLFKLRSYQPQPMVAVTKPAPSLPRATVVDAAPAPFHHADQEVAPKVIAPSALTVPQDAVRDVPNSSTDSTRRSDNRGWSEDEEETDEDDGERNHERGHGKGYGKYKHKGKHAKGKHGR